MGERQSFETWNRDPRETGHYRSLFWPIVIIGVGVGWLLASLGIIEGVALGLLWRLWPVLLIVAGLDVLFGRRWPAVGALLALLVVAGALALLVIGSATAQAGGTFSILGVPLRAGAELRTREVSVPADNVEEASVDISLARWPTTLSTLDASADALLQGEIQYTGNLTVDAQGSNRRTTVRIAHRDDLASFLSDVAGRGRWTLGLHPEVPTALRVDVSSGALEADLEAAHLTRLELVGGSGSIALAMPSAGIPDLHADLGSGHTLMTLPDGAELKGSLELASGGTEMRLGGSSSVDVTIDGGSGACQLAIGADSTAHVDFDGASGGLQMRVPDDAPLRVEVLEGGSGTISLPQGLERVSGEEGEEEGVWETPHYSDAPQGILLLVRMGSGSVHIN